jgi:hypothetical protein
LRAEGVSVRTILLADRPNAQQFEWAAQLGVDGVIFKTMDARLVVKCVRDVFSGKRLIGLDHQAAGKGSAVAASASEPGTLMRRQLQVARAAASGLSNKELATQLVVALRHLLGAEEQPLGGPAVGGGLCRDDHRPVLGRMSWCDSGVSRAVRLRDRVRTVRCCGRD